MRMSEYLAKYDSLASEDILFDIPYRKEFLLQQIGQGKRVLDVGCLGGRLSQLIRDQNNEVWGVEVNPRAARVAESRGIRVKIANVEDGLPFADETFDFVNAGDLVEYLYDTTFFFLECHRVLKPNGVLLLTTPNLNSLSNRIRITFGGFPSQMGAYPEDHSGEQVRAFNLPKMKELCVQNGFHLQRVSGISKAPLRRMRFQFGLMGFMMGKVFPSLSELFLVRATKVDAVKKKGQGTSW